MQLSDADAAEGCVWWRSENIIPCFQFCCRPKTVKKQNRTKTKTKLNQVYFKARGFRPSCPQEPHSLLTGLWNVLRVASLLHICYSAQQFTIFCILFPQHGSEPHERRCMAEGLTNPSWSKMNRKCACVTEETHLNLHSAIGLISTHDMCQGISGDSGVWDRLKLGHVAPWREWRHSRFLWGGSVNFW